jgi:hypothetical protein
MFFALAYATPVPLSRATASEKAASHAAVFVSCIPPTVFHFRLEIRYLDFHPPSTLMALMVILVIIGFPRRGCSPFRTRFALFAIAIAWRLLFIPDFINPFTTSSSVAPSSINKDAIDKFLWNLIFLLMNKKYHHQKRI